ncbi:hypothetical protein SAMN04487970_1007157 [Paenibacillus tianmuensis]|uniref:Uncharacterized protein n=1 Tax=Paenibacillus tianmuensis TaxID=624147 RepID=A0A1G4QKQ2_9BACL|nr:hypothetical protein [Paenibacillus tianmuensis]SCW44991.1 hypothetical protein SAMN04487970_1007157 [Paenibacillus tianmuensis]
MNTQTTFPFAAQSLLPEAKAELFSMVVYRYEDVFFQANRSGITQETATEPLSDTNEPIHQLLLRILNTRTLHGDQEALLDLYVLLQQDRLLKAPNYPSLHGLFDQKWDNLEIV